MGAACNIIVIEQNVFLRAIILLDYVTTLTSAQVVRTNLTSTFSPLS